MRPSAFDPAPSPLPLRMVVAIALLLTAGVALSVIEYLESASAVEAAPKPVLEEPLEPLEPPQPLTSTEAPIFVPYQGG